MSSAEPSLSSVKESISAIGLQPVLYTELVHQFTNAETLKISHLADEFYLISLDIFYDKDI